MKKLKNEDDLTLLNEVRIKFAWYSMILFAIELLIANIFFFCSKILFWIYIGAWILYTFYPNNYAKKYKAIKEELILRDLWK